MPWSPRVKARTTRKMETTKTRSKYFLRTNWVIRTTEIHLKKPIRNSRMDSDPWNESHHPFQLGRTRPTKSRTPRGRSPSLTSTRTARYSVAWRSRPSLMPCHLSRMPNKISWSMSRISTPRKYRGNSLKVIRSRRMDLTMRQWCLAINLGGKVGISTTWQTYKWIKSVRCQSLASSQLRPSSRFSRVWASKKATVWQSCKAYSKSERTSNKRSSKRRSSKPSSKCLPNKKCQAYLGTTTSGPTNSTGHQRMIWKRSIPMEGRGVWVCQRRRMRPMLATSPTLR